MTDPFVNIAPEQIKAIRNHLFNLHKSLSAQQQALIAETCGFSMLPPSRILDAYSSAEQAAKRTPDAAIVEFGVYRGGALAAMAAAAGCIDEFRSLGTIIGFDTFAGHISPPLPDEIDLHGNPQLQIYEAKRKLGESWGACDQATVAGNIEAIIRRLNLVTHGSRKIRLPILISGDATETAKNLPTYCKSISLLRLDMDWEEPTDAALNASEPLLTKNAVVIVDDYGHHSGVKKVVDKFIRRNQRRIDVSMTDYSCVRLVFL
jgi:O-methyltransferase